MDLIENFLITMRNLITDYQDLKRRVEALEQTSQAIQNSVKESK